MRRRGFIALLAGGLAWPVAAVGQQRVPRVGVIVVTDPGRFKALLVRALHRTGYAEGQNIQVETWSADGDPSRLPALAADLVASKVDVIVAYPTPAAIAAQRATNEIPIVVVAADPVGNALVTSLSRPGGNITGVSLVTPELAAKTLDLIRELLPAATRVGVLRNAADPATISLLHEVQRAGAALGMEVVSSLVHTPEGFEEAVLALKRERADALVVSGSLASEGSAGALLKHGLPAVSVRKLFAETGGLMAYGADLEDTYRRAAIYVDRILKGSKPADLPVSQPTKFELVINLKTAKALGIEIPPLLLARADEVIE